MLPSSQIPFGNAPCSLAKLHFALTLVAAAVPSGGSVILSEAESKNLAAVPFPFVIPSLSRVIIYFAHKLSVFWEAFYHAVAFIVDAYPCGLFGLSRIDSKRRFNTLGHTAPTVKLLGSLLFVGRARWKIFVFVHDAFLFVPFPQEGN